MSKSVVLYPGIGVGHLTPMIELAKVLVRHGVAVTVALVEPPAKSDDFSAAAARAAASNPSITFHVLPSPADSRSDNDTPPDPVVQMLSYLKAMNAPLRDLLRSLPAVDALVLDMFCGDALGVAAELKLPVYFFYASGAGDLAVFLNLPRMMPTGNFLETNIAGDESVLSFPGAPPFKASELPKPVLDSGSTGKAILRLLNLIPEANGILINTFESLETRAVSALRDGLCVPDHPTPPVYCIGPLVSGGGGDKEHECLRWLDMQPDSSVVFLSFGSMGTFPKAQLEQIAIGVEKSGQRFLWVVRSPRENPADVMGQPLPEPDLEALLPEGFLDRTKDRGLVLKSWAPQVDVLRHRAAGAFVTHCGWNSTLEGIMAGLPLLCWPLYAEQRMNKVFIVEEMKLGVEMNGYDKEMVKAEEVEMKIKWMMESEGGRALKSRVVEVKDKAIEALKEGGLSHAAFVTFLKDIDSMTCLPS